MTHNTMISMLAAFATIAALTFNGYGPNRADPPAVLAGQR
jgi:hypothetical protein